MANRQPHVPRFGNWDANDHAPYTKVFETARAGKGGKVINPNDPAQNPDAFGPIHKNPQLQPPQPPQAQPTRSRNSSREDGEYRKYMESPSQPRRQPVGRTASNNMNKSPLHPVAKAEKPSPALPKFGDWDAKDPSSGEGFTMIFNNARNERQVGGPGRIPPMNSDSHPHHQDHKHQIPKRSKFCCCFS